jgi:hypothetical protein
MDSTHVSEHQHWRVEARRRFPHYQDFIDSADEEYAVYNLFFELDDEFKRAITSGDVERASEMVDFAGRCLRSELVSDGEELDIAAGVSFFEHLFDDLPETRWDTVFSCMPREIYDLCRHYLEQWLGADQFAKVEVHAHSKYA